MWFCVRSSTKKDHCQFSSQYSRAAFRLLETKCHIKSTKCLFSNAKEQFVLLKLYIGRKTKICYWAKNTYIPVPNKSHRINNNDETIWNIFRITFQCIQSYLLERTLKNIRFHFHVRILIQQLFFFKIVNFFFFEYQPFVPQL